MTASATIKHIIDEKISEMTAAYVQRGLSRPTASHLPVYHAHTFPRSSEEGDDSALLLSREEVALVAAHRSSNRRGGFDHDVDAHPDSATEYEKTLKSDNCGIKGHAKRTCKKRKTAFLTTRVATTL